MLLAEKVYSTVPLSQKKTSRPRGEDQTFCQISFTKLLSQSEEKSSGRRPLFWECAITLFLLVRALLVPKPFTKTHQGATKSRLLIAPNRLLGGYSSIISIKFIKKSFPVKIRFCRADLNVQLSASRQKKRNFATRTSRFRERATPSAVAAFRDTFSRRIFRQSLCLSRSQTVSNKKRLRHDLHKICNTKGGNFRKF